MFDKLKKLLEGGVAQVNPFDGGKTYQSVVNNRTPQQQNAVQQQQAQARTFRQPGVAPQQTLTNKLRDILDANTEADKFRRAQVNQSTDYATQQREEYGVKRAPMNVGSQLFGNAARFANTAGAALGEIQDTSAVYGANVADAVTGGNQTSRVLEEVNKRQQARYNPKSGIFGAGTWFDNQDDFRKSTANPVDLARKAAVGTIGTAFEAGSMGAGQKVAKLADVGLKQFLARGGKAAAARAVEGVIADAASQNVERDNYSAAQGATAAVAGAGLPIVARGAAKVLRPVVGAASDALGRIRPRSVAEIAQEVNIARTAPAIAENAPAPSRVSGAPTPRPASEIAAELAASKARAIDPNVAARRASFSPTEQIAQIKRVNVSPDDQRILADFNDIANGVYKPDAKLQRQIELDATRIAEKYNIPLRSTALETADEFDNFLQRGVTKPEFAPKPSRQTNQLAPKPSKYKDADEFVKAQGEPVYHGTRQTFDEYNPNLANTARTQEFGGINATYFSPKNETALRYAQAANSGKFFSASVIDDIKKINPFLADYIDGLYKKGDGYVDKTITSSEDFVTKSGGITLTEAANIANNIRGSKSSYGYIQEGDQTISRDVNAFNSARNTLEKLGVSASGSPRVMEGVLTKDAKIKDIGFVADKHARVGEDHVTTFANEILTRLTRQAKEQGYDGVKFRTEQSIDRQPEIAVWNTDKIKTKKQLIEEFEQLPNYPEFPYSSPKESRKKINNGDYIQLPGGKDVRPEAPQVGKTDPLEALKAEARQATGARSDYSPENLQANRQIRAKNASSITYADKKAIKPDELVTVYRAVPGKAKGGLTEGDWVTPNKEQARLFMKQSWAQDDTGAKIVTKKVKASELRYHADDAKGYVDDELLYVPKSDPLEALKQEARKYKSADTFAMNIKDKEIGDNLVVYKGTGGDLDMGGATGFDYLKKVGDSQKDMPKNTSSFSQDKFFARQYGDVTPYTVPKKDIMPKEDYSKLIGGITGVGDNSGTALRGMWRRADKYPSVIPDVKKAGYKGFTDVNGEIVMFDRSSLTDLYNQATKPTKPKAYYQNVPKSYTEPKKTAFEQNTGVVAPTRKTNAAKAISNLEAEYSASKQALESNPAAELMKYANKRTMELPEVTASGKPTKFGKDGDQIVTELGYKDSEQARAEFEKFAMQRELHKNLETRYKSAREAARLAERENKAELTSLTNTPDGRGLEPAIAPNADIPTQQSAFNKTLKEKGYDIEVPGYQKLANEDVFAQAESSIAKDERGVINALLARNQRVAPTPLENAQSISLLSKLAREGRDEEALALAKATASSSREAGRAVQILSKLEAITPEGATVRAQRIIQEYNDKMSRKAKELTLTEDNYRAIKGLAEQAQGAEIGTRARDLAEGKLLKYIEDLVPASSLKKLSSAQTMAQLLNPKTAIRNILGNTVGTIAEDISTAPAAVVDRIISGLKGNGRSVAVANPFVKASGMKTGLKYGIEDVQLGIKTSGITGKFDVQPDVFKKGIMKKLQTALGYELGAPDKAFYQGQFDSTLDSLMRARKVSKPTLDMVEIANGEALYATFQNNSKLAGALTKTKGVLNLGKEWGMGDIVLKYPKTPGNIVSVGLDYSPYGILKGAAQLYKNWENLPLDAQREAVRNIGRGLTGTGTIALGYTLANNGIITGKQNADKDMSKLEREAGQGPFSFNMTALGRMLRGGDTKAQAGDTIMNYDWIQPAAIALSMGANMKINDKNAENGINAAWESLASGVDTITDQPVLKGVGDFAKTSFQPREQGGGIDRAISNAVASTPASFVPSSVNQVGQLTDPNARETRNPNFGLQVLDSVNARIPGLRNSLPAAKTSLGEDRTLYEKGKNNLFNVFLNPAFVKTYKDDEVVNLVRDINDRSGETQQVPRTADRSIKINGEQVKLQPTEYSKYQEYIGKKTNDQFGKLSQDPKFMALSDEEKAKKMSNVMSDINSAAKIELFGNKPKTVDRNVKRVLGGKDITSISSSSDAKTNKEKYQAAQEEFDNPDNGYSRVEKVKKREELKRLAVQKDYDEDTTMLHGMSKEDVYGFLSTYEDGKAQADKLLALDDALTAAGVQSKNKFRDKYGNVTIKPKEKGSGGSKAKTVKGQAGADASAKKLRALLASTNNKTTYRSPGIKPGKASLKKFAVKSAGLTSRKAA
jgi:hypothetical protein